jgi:type VI secretion system protein ImpJ
MKHNNRVAWHEGMFLRVQHFQQSDRWTERLVHMATRSLRPYPFGIANIQIIRQQLAIGRLALDSVSGTFADGTVFDAPGETDLPAPTELSENLKNAVIYLALPVSASGRAEATMDDIHLNRNVRLLALPYQAPDANIESDIVTEIEVSRHQLRQLVAGEDMAGFQLIGIARIVEVRPDSSVVLDDHFIPPLLNCAASKRLENLMTGLLGTIRHRSDAIAERIGDPTIRGTAEVGDFMVLQTLNRTEPVLSHLVNNATQVHPEEFYRFCVQLAGELATFFAHNKRVISFPAYDHLDLQTSFETVFANLNALLSAVLEQAAVAIPLQEKSYGIRIGTIHDRTLLSGAGFVLAVRAEMAAENLRRTLPAQIKVGPVERIAELVNVALPGIPVAPLPVLPRQLPYRSGTVYFELDVAAPMWKQLDASGAIALHIAGDFPGLEIELWALKG